MGPFYAVFGTIPQPFSPLALSLGSFIGRAKFALEIRDLWAESIVIELEYSYDYQPNTSVEITRPSLKKPITIAAVRFEVQL